MGCVPSNEPGLSMSTHQSSEPLQIDLRFSSHLALFLLLIHGGALAVAPLLTLPLWAAFGVMMGITMSLVTTLYTHVLLRGKHTVVRLMWGGDGQWVLVYADGVVRDAVLVPGSFVHPHLVILTFTLTGEAFPFSQRSVVIVADAVHPATFRRLRARLRAGF